MLERYLYFGSLLSFGYIFNSFIACGCWPDFFLWRGSRYRCFSLSLSTSFIMVMIFYVLCSRHISLLSMLKFDVLNLFFYASFRCFPPRWMLTLKYLLDLAPKPKFLVQKCLHVSVISLFTLYSYRKMNHKSLFGIA